MRRPSPADLGRASRGLHVLCLATAALIFMVLLAGCADVPPNPPLGPKPTETPNAGPAMAPDGETPEQAAARLFPAAYAEALADAESPELVEGAKPGKPVALSAVYEWDAQMVRWVLPGGPDAVTDDMFAAMWPSAMKDDVFFVPMVKNGRAVCQFAVWIEEGHWVGGFATGNEVPGGEVHWLDSATRRLEKLLGKGTEVRPVMFLPSGYAFAVGDNNGYEAACYLGRSHLGPGVEDVDVPLDRNVSGYFERVLTPAELKEALTPLD